MIRHLSRWQPWLSTAVRLFLAGVFFLSGWPKFTDPDGTVRSVRAFKLVPEPFVHAFAYALPVVELSIGVLLVLGLFTRYVSVIYAGMMVMFIGGIISVWARGLSINCGCFGNSGSFVSDPVPGYIKDLLRDGGILVLALGLIRWPRGVLDLDRVLGLTPPPRALTDEADDEDEDDATGSQTGTEAEAGAPGTAG